jgi:hypothetical protein
MLKPVNTDLVFTDLKFNNTAVTKIFSTKITVVSTLKVIDHGENSGTDAKHKQRHKCTIETFLWRSRLQFSGI